MTHSDASPLIRQYREIKRGYPDSVLFFRVGDFYEMFDEDAREASRLLSIALTSRDKSSTDPVPLCGIPYHASQGYIAKLLKAGRTVALCEQVEDPKSAKGLVRREVVRLYTPGTLVDTEFLSPSESNFLTAICRSSRSAADGHFLWGLAGLDVSTGEFWVMEFGGIAGTAQMLDELVRVEPREVLYPESAQSILSFVTDLRGIKVCPQPATKFNAEHASITLQTHFQVHSLDGFGCQGLTVALGSAGAVWQYFRETQPTASFDHVRRVQRRWNHDAMHLDQATIRNLELVRPLNGDQPGVERGKTVLSVLDRTVTSMGGRLLRDWLLRPLLDREAIQRRLDAVAELKNAVPQRVAIRTILRSVQDIARLSSRMTLRAAGPRECIALKESLSTLPELRAQLETFNSSLLTTLRDQWDDCRDISTLIEDAIHPEAPLVLRDGNIIREGYHGAVDDLRKTRVEGKEWIAALEARERNRTGIDSLKIRYNQVFGYYIEITKANLQKVPPDYSRKQTLVNAERFMTHELSELERRVTGSEAQLASLEEELFGQVRDRIAREVSRLQSMSGLLATVDVLTGLAEAAALGRYVQPTVDNSDVIAIVDGRHPVVESLNHEQMFVANDTRLDGNDNRLLILTGPNMAGKSTYLRQVALIVLLAQIGSFVPATEARIGLADRVFTRVGASDNLAGGQSTFMVEMTESAHILNSATNRSLILLDEIGRGTSTYDGLSIAWAIAEYIHDQHYLGARTLFATHYHEMTQLESLRDGIKNYRVAVREQDGDVVFLRKIMPGGADRSYGIHVAKLAGLPGPVITRAQEVLTRLEQPDSSSESTTTPLQHDDRRTLPQPHSVIDEVRQIDLFSMTPLDALNRLAELQKRVTQPQ
ncbi:DNA mismatch repair protein MutS [Nitrospira sp. KM1]|uniref:DNA mismatch repair protein MutS n=1 Tax=Nitrospira sp. KM1 TaxID=1936990 RepID=UPI0013A735BC|nr:DNA mismatch repair protein MutS [Nitrospira sp. KM1]BCA55000.1 DNA mismatch repair protein MutS [Nitrospira sp. KM1]